jgi:hypothetical protein
MKTRSSLRTLSFSLPLAAAVLGSAAPAHADEAANTATARALGIEGVVLANAGRCPEAIAKLERAEKLHHAPTTATRLGECEIAVGKLVRGTERLQRVVRERLPPHAHPAFVSAVARAQGLLDKTLPRIATLRVTVSAPPGATLSVQVDGEDVPEAAIVDADRRMDPGSHEVEISAEGFLPAVTSVALDEGETRSVSLELRPDPAARPSAVPREAGSVRFDPAPERGKPSKVPAFVAFGIGAAGLGVGLVAAANVERKSALLSSSCGADKVCPAELQPEIEAAKTWATVSTVGFIAGGVGVVSGLVYLLASGSSSPAPKTGVRVRPTVSAGSVGIDGVF